MLGAFNKGRTLTASIVLLVAAFVMFSIACGETVREVEVVKVVEKEVPVEVIKEVAVEKIVKEQVVKEVEVEVEKEVIKEVQKIVEVEVEVEVPEGPKREIVFGGLNWDSALVQNGIARYIVEHGYGHKTSQVEGATVPLFQGLRKGDIDITMEIWLPNQNVVWNEAVKAGAETRRPRAEI